MEERLEYVINYLILTKVVSNKSGFAKIIGRSPSHISDMLSGKRNITDDFIDMVCKCFPQINPKWLTTGEESMLLADEKVPIMNTIIRGNVNSSNIGGHNNTIQQGNEVLEEKVRTLEATIADLREALKSERETNALLRSLIQNK